jgi:hypothetical protein
VRQRTPTRAARRQVQPWSATCYSLPLPTARDSLRQARPPTPRAKCNRKPFDLVWLENRAQDDNRFLKRISETEHWCLSQFRRYECQGIRNGAFFPVAVAAPLPTELLAITPWSWQSKPVSISAPLKLSQFGLGPIWNSLRDYGWLCGRIDEAPTNFAGYSVYAQ